MNRAPFACPSVNGIQPGGMSVSNSLSMGAPPFRPQVSMQSSGNGLSLSDQQKVLVSGGIAALQQHQLEAKDRQMVNRRSLTRTASCSVYPQNGVIRHSVLNQHRALQRSTSYDSNQILAGLATGPGTITPITTISGTVSPNPLSPGSTPGLPTNGYRSRETGVIEKLLVSYGFIKCADREGRLFFHYSQFHGEAQTLHINDEVEFEVSMDNRTGKPVAVHVVRLQKGTVVFEVLSEERILGEVTNPAPPLSLVPGQNSMNAVPGGTTRYDGLGYRPSEKGEPIVSGKLGSLSYERMGEFFFLHYSANDLTNPNNILQPGDKVSFNIATEKRSGVMRARKITLVERAPPKRFTGIVTAMKESFGFIERADLVKEIFFHYSEVLANVPDLHVGDHVEFSIQERNNKDVATEVRLLPMGSVKLEEVSSQLYAGTIEKPLPAKASNKVVNEATIAGGDATSPNQTVKNTTATPNNATQPSLALAGLISYVDEKGELDKIPFGEKDRAANCLHTLCQGDKVSFLTITDKRNGLQRAAGVTLLLDKTLAATKEKREQGIVAAVKEGFGFIKCVERDSRLFFHCCELLDPSHHIRMSDEVEFTVLLDPVAEKQRCDDSDKTELLSYARFKNDLKCRMHATRIKILPRGTVIFHIISDQTYVGVIDVVAGNTAPLIKSPSECLYSPGLGPNPGVILYFPDNTLSDNIENAVRLPYAHKDFQEWQDVLNVKAGSVVEFKVCEVKRTGAKSAVNIKLLTDGDGFKQLDVKKQTLLSQLKLAPLPEDTALISPIVLENMSLQPPTSEQSPPIRICSDSSALTLSSMSSSPMNQTEQDSSEDSEDVSKHLVEAIPMMNISSNDENVENLSDAANPSVQSETSMTPDTSFGWISTLKDTFGFIEAFDHTSEIFFHFSELLSPLENFKVATPVCFVMGIKEEKPCAMKVQKITEDELPAKSIVASKMVKGKVLKPLKSVNPAQSTYQGLIEYKETSDAGQTTIIKTIPYSPLSLCDRRDFIQVGDKVTFQISTNSDNSAQRAVKVNVTRETVRATVESIKGEYGFINYEVKGGDSNGGNGKLFFHMSEVREPNHPISPGSVVEFSVIYNQRSGKFSASKVRLADCASNQPRPERLRLRSTCDSTSGPTVVVLRQPRGPSENVTGFQLNRNSSVSQTDDSQVQPPTDA